MAKNITRTITTYSITFLALDESDAVVSLYVNDTEANQNLPKHPEKVAAAAAAEMGMTFIKVKCVGETTQLYSMPISEFVANATPAN